MSRSLAERADRILTSVDLMMQLVEQMTQIVKYVQDELVGMFNSHNENLDLSANLGQFHGEHANLIHDVQRSVPTTEHRFDESLSKLEHYCAMLKRNAEHLNRQLSSALLRTNRPTSPPAPTADASRPVFEAAVFKCKICGDIPESDVVLDLYCGSLLGCESCLVDGEQLLTCVACGRSASRYNIDLQHFGVCGYIVLENFLGKFSVSALK